MTRRTAPSNSDDVIDSRDIIARMAELEALVDADDNAELADDAEVAGEDERAELAILRALAEQAEGYAPDWHHGTTLIADHYFTEYAQQTAEDIGAIGRDLQWPACHIDWDAAADALKQDYTAVDFDGETYWVR